MITISEIYIYPVKSCAGIKLTSSQLSHYGLLNDRRWMIVDENGRFISQREHHKMAIIQTHILDDQLSLSYGQKTINVPQVNNTNKEINTTIWKDNLNSLHISEKVDQWLSDILGVKCHLVYMPSSNDAEAQRQIDTDYAAMGQLVSFADAFPILVISQASLDDFNEKLGEVININRFRPNIVLKGTKAYAEDDWRDLTINEVEFKAIKKCSRCVMPSINQETGIQDNKKILSTLSRFRREDKKVKFGQNLIYKDAHLIEKQIISCGDEIKLK